MATAVRSRTSAKARSALDNFDVHEAANLFPIIDDDNLKALAEDIRIHGQQEPIWMFEGQLLDGRNRVIACAMIGRDPIRKEWKPQPGETPATFVMSRNVHRRHLTASQRAAVAVQLEAVIASERKEMRKRAKATEVGFSSSTKAPVSLTPGGSTSVKFTSNPEVDEARVGEKVRPGRSRDQAAQAMRVSAGYVNDAKDLKKAAPDTFEKVLAGEMTIGAAQHEVVAKAHSTGTLSDVKLRPGAIRAAMEKIEAENRPKAKEKPPAIRLPKASKVVSSATTVAITVTFGNRTVAEEWLNRLQDDKKVLDLDYEVLDKRPAKKRASKTA